VSCVHDSTVPTFTSNSLPDDSSGSRVHTRGGFINEYHAGVSDHGHGATQLSFVTSTKRASCCIFKGTQGEVVDELGGYIVTFIVRVPNKASKEFQGLPYGELGSNAVGLRAVSNNSV
jgi:hypothetical protein